MTHTETITDDLVRKVKLDAPEFDGRLESTTFLDLLDKMDEFLSGTCLMLNVLVWLGLS